MSLLNIVHVLWSTKLSYRFLAVPRLIKIKNECVQNLWFKNLKSKILSVK